MNRFIPCVVALLAVAPHVAAAQAPSTADVRAAVERGEYQAAVKMVAQAQRATGASKRADRHELLMLKGDALLGGGSRAYAAHAYEDALHAATTREQRAAARAAGLPAGRPPGRPAGTRGAPGAGSPAAGDAALLRPEARNEAMRTLYEELRRSVEPKVRDAAAGTSLPPMYEVLPSLADLASLELAADNSLDKTLPLMGKLGERARELIGAEIGRLDSEAERVGAAAGEVEMITGGGFLARRGLHTDDRKALQEAGAYLAKIMKATREGRRIAGLVEDPDAAERWEDLGVAASDVAERIESVLARRY